MIKSVDKKYCHGNLVQLMPHTDTCHLIMNQDEIILLKIGNKVLINKYINHPSRHLFPYHENEKHTSGCHAQYNVLYEYNKIYLNFRTSISGYSFRKDYFFKGTDRALWLNESLLTNRKLLEEHSQILDRKELEQVFNSDNYDSMYIIDVKGRIMLAKNNTDGCIIKKDIIPTDEEIIDIEYQERVSNHYLGELFRSALDNENPISATTAGIKPRTIEEINNVNIYGSLLFSEYSHVLITSKKGEFNIKFFRLDFIEKDKFKLTTGNVPVVEPTIDYVLDYTKEHTIEQTEDPNIKGYKSKEKQEENIEETASSPKVRRKWPSWLHPKHHN